MILSRSLERIRPLGPYGYGLPYVLDYKRAILKPYLGTGECEQTKDGRYWRWLPALQRMFPLTPTLLERYMALLQPAIGMAGSYQAFPDCIGYEMPSTISLSSANVNSAYTFGSAGVGVCWRVFPHAALTFDTIYYCISSYGGTAANVNDISVEVRGNTTSKPNSTLHDSVISNPASATGWISTSGFTFSGSADTPYWVCMADPDGNATDFAVLARAMAGGSSISHLRFRNGFSSTNGFSAITDQSSPCVGVVKFSNGTVMGNPFSATGTSTSGTQERGLRIDGLTERLKIFGFSNHASMSTAPSIAKVYAGSTLPGGTPYGTFSNPMSTESTIFGFVGAPITLVRATQHRIVFDYGTATVAPHKLSVGTGTDANLRAAMIGGGNWYWTEEDETGPDWDNDDISAWPRCVLYVEDQGLTLGRRANYQLGL